MSERKRLKIEILESQLKELQAEMNVKLNEINALSAKYNSAIMLLDNLTGNKKLNKPQMPDMDNSTVILNKMRKARIREKKNVYDGNDSGDEFGDCESGSGDDNFNAPCSLGTTDNLKYI